MLVSGLIFYGQYPYPLGGGPQTSEHAALLNHMQNTTNRMPQIAGQRIVPPGRQSKIHPWTPSVPQNPLAYQPQTFKQA